MNTLIAFLASLALNSSYPDVDTLNRQQMYCLAQAVHWEAGGEPRMGQVAVAHVIINRVHSNRYPGTVCEVVYQPYQFTGLRRSYRPSEDKYWKIVLETSILSYIGFIDDPTNGALNYYAHKGPQALDQDPWPGMTKLADIGNHRFKCGRRK